MDFGPHSLQLDRPTYATASRTMAFNPECFFGNDSIFFSSENYQVLMLLIYLPQMDGRLSTEALKPE